MSNLHRIAAAAALCGLLGAAAPPPGPVSGDAAVASIAKAYFAEAFRAAPVYATATGVHGYDASLGDNSAAAFAAAIARDHRTIDLLSAIDQASLSGRGALDRAMLENTLRADLVQNETMERWKHKPDDYLQTASGGVFVLISRNFAPARVRLASVIAREEAIPKLFAQARANIVGTDRDTAQIAVDDAMGTVAFFQKTVPQAFAGVGDAATRARFRASTKLAADATRAYAAYVKRWVAHPVGTYAIGAENYALRLRYEEAITMPLAEYLAVGEKALAKTRAEMVATAKRIDPKASVEQVLAKINHIHPTAANLIPASQADLVKLRAFIMRKHIIDLPSDADISVTLTPEFLRQTTVASMDAPGPLERVAKAAYYNVTPVDPRDTKKAQEAYLEVFNDFERPIVSAHEVYPGHYTNFIIDKHLPLTLIEKLTGATSFIEGWAHYDEQMMVDEGWGGGDPRVRIMQLKEAILRNARFVVGVKMHTQGMTVKQAQAVFRDAFFDEADARIEARRGTQDATYGYYTLGKMEILKLREDYKKKLGSAFTLARFHKDLLQYGDPAIPLLRPLLLGADDDGKILPEG